MSEVLAGWAQTISLNDAEIAVVAARLGEAWLRFPDAEREPMALTRAFVDTVCGHMRICFANSPAPQFYLSRPGQTLSVAVDRAAAEPLIALMREAATFAEGG